ncbi:MAG TPA: GNAT family N-acetyltransferase [Parvularcula sp.]|nr:GNAT family N-acetyltransferase [Parvularcula sp.]HBS32411.1 GNAT family N-acetyltransferase [Parvularcula sp.]HBS36164.1 GNAT family N-acetyltransferase [Parvularcula sp.]
MRPDAGLMPAAANRVAVRAARSGDLTAIEAIESRSFSADRFSRTTLKRLIAGRTASVVVAVASAAAAGYAAILFRKGSTVARLYSIAVDPAARGQGVATALIKAAIRIARRRGADRLRLEVRASNALALSLYDRSGFTFLGRSPGYYQDGEDAIRLERRL